MNNLEKYLGERKKDMDVEYPDDENIWKGISKRLRKKQGILFLPLVKDPVKKILRIAAVIFILFSVGYITRDIVLRRSAGRGITLVDISQALGKKENEYRTLVNIKSDEVKAFSTTDNIIIRELFDEIRRLDAVYDQSLKDLKELGYNEKVVNTIFDTYEKKIHLLELIILETNKSGSHENNGKINL